VAGGVGFDGGECSEGTVENDRGGRGAYHNCRVHREAPLVLVNGGGCSGSVKWGDAGS